MTTVALIQARMSSSRFPGKVLEDLCGRPMIAYMFERLRPARLVDVVALVTSTDPSDDVLAITAETHGIPVFRGDLHDVLDRYASAAELFQADVIVRLTGDCPLIDPAIVDQVVALRERTGADYASNVDPPSFADGLDVECFTRQALERARREATQPSEREHVTLWMRADDNGLRRENHAALADSSHIRLTVDHSDDLQLVRLIADRLTASFNYDHFDILRLLDANRSLLGINQHKRNEGLESALATAGFDSELQSIAPRSE